MKNVTTALKKGLFTALIFATLVFFAGCSATVNTTLQFKDDFSGQRDMVLLLNGSDRKLERQLDKIIATYKPTSLQHTKQQGDNQLQFTFSIPFANREDYLAKVNEILSANPNNTITPQITTENTSTPFRGNTQIEENFSSSDLLGWLSFGADHEGLLGRDIQQEWYQLGGTTLVLGEKTYTIESANLSFHNQWEHTLNSIIVSTYLLPDDAFTRSIEFAATAETVQALAQQGTNLQAYFESICPNEAELVISNINDATQYTFTFAANSADGINQLTNQLLQNQNNQFSGSFSPMAAQPSVAEIKVTEALDGSYYLNEQTPVVSRLYPLAGSVPSPANAQSLTQGESEKGTYYEYTPVANGTVLTFTWQLYFKDVDLALTLSDEVGAKLHLAISKDLSETQRKMAHQSLETALPEGAKLSSTAKDNDILFTVQLAGGTAQEVANQYNAFTQAFTTEKTAGLSSLEYTQTPPSFIFEKAHTLTGTILLTPFTGGQDGTVTINTALAYQIEKPGSNSTLQTLSVPAAGGKATLSATVNTTNTWALVITGILVLFTIFLAILLIRKLYFSRRRKAPAGTAQGAPPPIVPVETVTVDKKGKAIPKQDKVDEVIVISEAEVTAALQGQQPKKNNMHIDESLVEDITLKVKPGKKDFDILPETEAPEEPQPLPEEPADNTTKNTGSVAKEAAFKKPEQPKKSKETLPIVDETEFL